MTLLVHWDIHVWYVRNICSGTYANNVKYLYTSFHGDIIDFFYVYMYQVCIYIMSYVYIGNSFHTSHSVMFSKKYLSFKFSGLLINSSNKAEEGTS